MKKALVCLLVSISLPASAVPMARVIGVRDSHTIVVESNGALSTVTLKGIVIEPQEETQAADYLRRLIANSWVYVENGDVYRSPDALYVNGDMNRHTWRMMRVLGELDLPVREKPAPAKPASRGTGASRTKSRRSGRSQ